MNIKDNFFCFTRRVEVVPGDNESAINVINGVAWESIERFYTDENGTLNIIVKSQTDGYRMELAQEGKKVVQRKVKTTINVILMVEEVDDVKRFLEYMGLSTVSETQTTEA